MKHLDEYRDGDVARVLSRRIQEVADRPMRLMEICGTHTMSIFKHGIRTLLPETIELVSGPGCPVCVTAMSDIDRMVRLARIPGVMVATFGDMFRVPGSRSSLQMEKARGADVRMVYSTFDALALARKHPETDVVFLGIGFETTAPTVAAAVQAARMEGLTNFSVLSLHKLLPPAMDTLLSGGDLGVDGFICPGHVTTIIGARAYEPLAEQYRVPCVVTGFEPLDILQGILMLSEQIGAGRYDVEIQYVRGATWKGNSAALDLLAEVFVPCDAAWRGLGEMAKSGLNLKESYAAVDAARRFDLAVPPAPEPPGCRCAEILRGKARPPDCRLFGAVCTPAHPVGPCMVSSEGTCAAYFKYTPRKD